MKRKPTRLSFFRTVFYEGYGHFLFEKKEQPTGSIGFVSEVLCEVGGRNFAKKRTMNENEKKANSTRFLWDRVLRGVW